MRIKETYETKEYFIELSSFIKEFTSSYSTHIVQKIVEKNEYLEEPKRFFYTLIHKINCSLDASNIFIENFDSKRNFHTPLFILFRSILNDIILAEYVIITAKSDTDKKKLIDQIYFDHIDNTLKTCKKTLPDIYNWSKKEMEKQITKLKKSSRFFDSNGNPKIKSVPTNPNQIIRKIFSNKIKSESSKLLTIAFDQFSIFSKFEHFGELSFELTHRGYDDKNQDELRYEVHFTIRIIIAALNNYAKTWEDDLDIKRNYFKKLHTEITEILPGKITVPNNV